MVTPLPHDYLYVLWRCSCENSDQSLSAWRHTDTPFPDYLRCGDILSINRLVGVIIGLQGCATQSGSGKQAAFCPRISKDVNVRVVGTDCLRSRWACDGGRISA